jgi:hypothetical protein
VRAKIKPGPQAYFLLLFSRSAKTYNSGYSLVVTHLTTNPPVRCLNRAERTGSLVFNVLWSYVKGWTNIYHHIMNQIKSVRLSPDMNVSHLMYSCSLTDIDM